MDSSALNNNSVIQHLLQKADELTNQTFGANSAVTVVGEDQYPTAHTITINTANTSRSSNSRGVRVEEVDEATANQIIRSLSTTNVVQQYQLVDESNSGNTIVEAPAPALFSSSNYAGELYQDPHPPQIIRRPPAQSPITYRQNVSVRFLQPPPLPPPGALIIKEVRPPQPPAPRPLVIRQRAPPLPTPPPLVLRERPPRGPTPIPTQTVIRKLAPIPVPPRSVVVERFPAIPARPRDVIIERWVPYSKEPQKRKVITYRAPQPRPYPAPRNTIIAYEPIQAHVVRSVHKVGVQQQNPHEYALRHGSSLLDAPTLVAQAQHLGINDDLSPPSSDFTQHYQGDGPEYYLSSSQTVAEPEYEYTTSTVEVPQANNNEQVQVYWTDPHEDVRVTLQRLGFAIA